MIFFFFVTVEDMMFKERKLLVNVKNKIQLVRDIFKLVHACEFDYTLTSHFPLKEWLIM